MKGPPDIPEITDGYAESHIAVRYRFFMLEICHSKLHSTQVVTPDDNAAIRAQRLMLDRAETSFWMMFRPSHN
jgi:hypothetical protein